MALWDRVSHFLALEAYQDPPMQTRTGTIEDLVARITSSTRVQPWRPASIKEALSVPAIYRCVSFIANTTGALSLEAYRNGVKLANEDRPRLIVRPDPFRTPRDFFRDTSWNMASTGEAWWWVAARDIDGSALSLLNVPPHEIMVTENTRDLRYPTIEWRGKPMRNEDMIQITLNRLPGELRGSGPLQLCGAAVSVAVEAQEWAANFYGEGGIPSIWIKAGYSMNEAEAIALKAQWTDSSNNVPKVTDTGIEDIKQFEVNTASASMFEARDFQNAEAARMFGVSASLLDIPVGGSSLTYQNLEQEFTKFVKTCLWPNYLEPQEQTMSDLLTRSTVSRFNVDAFVRPDTKTRHEVYKLAIEAGVMTPEQAAQKEGIEPGDVENAPMPLAQPQAIPSSLPIQMRTEALRCPSCSKLLAEAAGYGTRIRCSRCKTVAEAPMPATVPDPLAHLPERIAAALPAPVPLTPAPVLNFNEGAFKAGDVHVAADEQTLAVAVRVEATQERLERSEREWLGALQKMGELQEQYPSLLARFAEDIRPKPVQKRIIRDADNRIIGVEEIPSV